MLQERERHVDGKITDIAGQFEATRTKAFKETSHVAVNPPNVGSVAAAKEVLPLVIVVFGLFEA